MGHDELVGLLLAERLAPASCLAGAEELGLAVGPTEMAGNFFCQSRKGKNGWHGMVGQLRQSVLGRLGGYDDVNDAAFALPQM